MDSRQYHRLSDGPAVRVVENWYELATNVANRVSDWVQRRRMEQRHCVLGLASGQSPRPVYAELWLRHVQNGSSFENCVTFSLDEYFPMDPDSPYSFEGDLERQLSGADIPSAHRFYLRGNMPYSVVALECARYDEKICEWGGIDFLILGIGRNGHLAFNEPGSRPSDDTRIVDLHPWTREDAKDTFGGLDNVPLRALTLGMSILMGAREIALIAFGEDKHPLIERLLYGPIGSDFPASYLRTHPRVVVYTDRNPFKKHGAL